MRAAEGGNAWDFLLLFTLRFFFLGGKRLNYDIKQISGSRTLNGGESNWFTEAQRVKFNSVLATYRVISFVSSQNHRFSGAAQHVGYFFISRSDACTSIHHEDNHIGFFDGQLSLRPDTLHDIAGLPIQSYLANRDF